MGSSGTFYEYGNKDQYYLANQPKFCRYLEITDIDNIMYKNYTFIKESVHSFLLKYRYWEKLWKECSHTKKCF